MSFFKNDPSLGEMVEAILDTTWQAFPDLQRDQIALTWLVYDAPVVVNTGGAISAN